MINSIGNINPTQGYYVSVSEPYTLPVTYFPLKQDISKCFTEESLKIESSNAEID